MDSPLLVKSKQFASDIIKVCNKVKGEKRESFTTKGKNYKNSFVKEKQKSLKR